MHDGESFAIAGMLSDRVRVGCLVDADRAEPAIELPDDIATDPAHLVGHFIVTDPRGLGGRGLKLWALWQTPFNNAGTLHHIGGTVTILPAVDYREVSG